MYNFQKSQKTNGFTLIELMVVIVLMGILAISVSSFNFTSKTDTEKSERFTQAIVNLLDKAKSDALLGRGVLSGGNLVNPTSVQVNLSSTGITTAYNGTSINGLSLVSPFYNDANYKITNITAFKGDGNAGTSPTAIVFKGSTIDFDSSASGSVLLNIITKYNTATKTISFDRRTGKIDIK